MAALTWVQNYVLGPIAVRDHKLMRTVHRWRAPRWIRLWMTCATRGGDGWLWYALALALALFGGDLRWQALAACALAVGSGIALFLWVKKVANRKRPCALEPHCWSTLLPPDQFSFPSGHTITAFAFTVALTSYYPEVMAGLMFAAVSIAVSRIVLGMHFLSDVVAGAILGSGIGYLSYLVTV
jgi:undecaprenyl-diphosphatase